VVLEEQEETLVSWSLQFGGEWRVPYLHAKLDLKRCGGVEIYKERIDTFVSLEI
jgi:hypothetical protein